MTTTTIGTFTVEHENGVLQSALKVKKEVFYTESDFLREFSLAAATEIERLRACVDEREHDMHMRIRAVYDSAVADLWKAHCAKIATELAASKDEIERLRAALDVATTGRASAAEGYREVIRELSEDRERIKAELAAAVAASPVVIGIRDGDSCPWMPMTLLPFYDADYRLKMDDGSVIKNEHGWKGFKGIDHRKITAWGIAEAQVVSLLKVLRRSHEDMDDHLAASRPHAGNGVGK